MKKLFLVTALFTAASGLQAHGGDLNPTPPPGPSIYFANNDVAGNQQSIGNLAEIFTISQPIMVEDLGVFDNGDPSSLNIQVGIAKISGGVGTPVPGLTYPFTPGNYTNPTFTQGNEAFYALPTPIVLGPGQYEVDSIGFYENQLAGDTDCNGVSHSADPNCTGGSSNGTVTNDLGGIVTFQGGVLDINDCNGLVYPTGITDSSSTSLAAGTLIATPVPEGGASALYLLLAGAACFGGIFFRRRSGLANRV
jgi:hypothetical protein